MKEDRITIRVTPEDKKEIELLENYFDVSYNEKQILAIKNAYEKNFSIETW